MAEVSQDQSPKKLAETERQQRAIEKERSLSLKEQIEADRQRRAEEFRQRFHALCEELECDLVGVPGFTDDGRVVVKFQVQTR